MTINQTYEQLTFARIRVLGQLAQGKTIRELATALGFTYNGARSHIRDLRNITGCAQRDEMRDWWRLHKESYLAFVRHCASGG